MSAGKTYKNPGRALPPIPISSANSSPNKNKNLQISQKAESLASIIPKEPSPPSSARPQLDQQESSDKVELEATGNPESQPHTPQHPPQPTTRDLPASPTKFQRRVTASGKRPVLLMPSIKSPRLTVQESPRFSPTFSLSPRTLTPVSENSPVNYFQQFDDLAAELADILDSETKTSERPTKNNSEPNTPNKKPGKSSNLSISLEDLEISGQDLSARSPEKTSAWLEKLRSVSLVKPLPTEHRLPRVKAPPSKTAAQEDPGGTGPGSDNTDIKNN